MTGISPLGSARSRRAQFHPGPICHPPALQAVHPSDNVRPLVLHWSVPFLSLSELRNTFGVHPLEIKLHRRTWIFVLHPGPYPFDVLAHPRGSWNPRCRTRTLTSLVCQWTPSDAWLDNGIPCMMASSASKSCGILDTSPAATVTRSASNLSMNSQDGARPFRLLGPAAVSGPSQDPTQARRYMEPRGATSSWRWSPSTSSRFSNIS